MLTNAKEAMNIAAKAHLDAKVQALQEILDEIKSEEYETVSQVMDSIHNNMNILKKLKVKQGENNG